MRIYRPMQIRYPVKVSSVFEYNKQNLCEKAELVQCPIHPDGGCGIRRHGSYIRLIPIEFKVPRWYCRAAHTVISLLPDFLPSRLSGTLKDVEEIVLEAKKHPTLVSAAETIRPDIGLQGALRWLCRRLDYVDNILNVVAGIMSPFGFKDLLQLQELFNVKFILPHLREKLNNHLYKMTHILGLISPQLDPVDV